MDNLKTELLEQIEKLTPSQQNQVLDFVMELSGDLPDGTPLKELLKFAGAIPSVDLEQIKQAIAEGCEQVYESEWEISIRYEHRYCDIC